MFLSVCPLVFQSVQAHTCISVTAGRNCFNLGKMMSYNPGLMSIFFSHDHDDPLPFYSTIYNIAVVNMVLSKYFFKI